MKKRMNYFGIFIIIALFFSSACEKQENVNIFNVAEKNLPQKVQIDSENLRKAMKAVEPFFEPMGKPQPDEWLYSFKETGQTFDEYTTGNPMLPTTERKIIYIQPLGRFSERQRKVIKLTAEYMKIFFNLPTRLLPAKSFDEKLTKQNFRYNQLLKVKQIRTGYIMSDILQPHLPNDAAAIIAFTDEDLYPDETMNFLFGQASLENRVGVWSLYRLDDEKDFKLFLIRTLKIATHETGHMFSIAHCTKYECLMSGCNHLGETDKHPLDACPECMAKICWMTKTEPLERYEKLSEFCRVNDLPEEAAFFAKEAEAVRIISNSANNSH